MSWTREFAPNKVLKMPEYFVYCGVFKTQSWDKRSAQIAKGEFLEVPFIFASPKAGSPILPGCIKQKH